jgi:hypothetical protein
VRYLGSVAERSESAFSYLTNHMTPDRWYRTRKRRATTSVAEADIVLAQIAIQALGRSGRPIVPGLLDQMIASNSDYLAKISGGIADAAYTLSVMNQSGREALFDLGFDCTGSNYRRWSRTDEGKKWIEWHRGINQLADQ